MEFYEESLARQRGIERMMLLLFGAYILMMIWHSVRENWPIWIPICMVVLSLSSWILYLKEYKNYMTRTLISSIGMAFSMLMAEIYIADFWSGITSFYVFSVLIALYGVVEYIYISLAVAIIIFMNYAFRANGLLSTPQGVNILVVQGFNIGIFEFLLYIWVKNRIRSMQQSIKTIDALKLVERSKDDFLANVSHEIRTPLNTISGMSEIALAEQNVDTIHEYMYSIQTASRNLMSTVSDILDFSELQAGQITLDEEDYNITSTVNDIINMTMALREDRRIEVIVNYDAGIPRVLFGDEKKIRRVVMNLVSNAVKFTKDGGISITIRGRRENYGINLAIIVKDTGIGMNAENLEKLYTSFGQLDTRRNRQNGGIGLGLAISKALVEKMGGTLLISSEYGKGSTVQVVIPQKIVDDTPAVLVRNKEQMKALIYIDMERFTLREIRDAYSANMENIISQLEINSHICRSLAELKRRIDRENFNLLVIANEEYKQDVKFFESIASDIQIIVILDREDDKDVTDSRVCRIYKPFSVLSIASALNGINRDNVYHDRSGRFIAPTAKVLVVDDNYMNIRVVQGLLAKYEIGIEYALCGAEALEKIESMDFDFVFMDHMMPEMDGIETAHRIRNKIGSYYQTVPIIALTANAIAGTREMFIKEGFADFVEKPVELSVLERVLRRNLPEKKIIYEQEPGKEGTLNKDFKNRNNTISSESRITGEEIDAENNHNDIHVDEKMGLEEIKELDVATGELYCGGQEGYKDILIEFIETAVETRLEIDQLYQQKDWNNYVIKVHALKGCMKTIGAVPLSELAFELEQAGKNDNIELIISKHDNLLKEHQKLFKALVEYPVFREMLSEDVIAANLSDQVVLPEKNENDENLKEISPEEFEAMLKEFETATYSLDGDAMNQIVDALDGCRFAENSLEDIVKKVRKKIAQEDYFSAYELLSALCSR